MHAITLIPTEGGDTTGLLTGYLSLVHSGKTILSEEEKQSSRFKGSRAPRSEWGVERPSTADSYFTLQSIRKITTNVQDNTWIFAHMCRQAPCAEHTILPLTKGKCKLRV